MQVKLHAIPERKFLASGTAGLAAYFLMLLASRAFGIELTFDLAVPIAAGLMLLGHYYMPPSLQDLLRRIDDEMKRRFALEELADPASTLDPEAATRLREGAGAVARALVLLLLVGGLAIAGPVACASYRAISAESPSPARTVYALQADYTAALGAAVAYAESPAADPDVVDVMARLDRAAYAALGDARDAVRAGDGLAAAASMAIARAAVAELVDYVTARAGGAS